MSVFTVSMVFSDPELLEPTVHCFARCHWCKQLIPIKQGDDGLELGGRDCPKCGVEVSQERILGSWVVNQFHTRAITSANKFISLDFAVLPFLAAMLLISFMGFPLWIRIPYLILFHGALIAGLGWFQKYWYRVRFTDDEYLQAVKLMKRYLLVWFTAVLINWIVIVLQLTVYPPLEWWEIRW